MKNLAILIVFLPFLIMLSLKQKKQSTNQMKHALQEPCDTTKVTYKETIRPVINTYCAIPTCHIDNYDNGDYTTYEGIVNKINAKKFLKKHKIATKAEINSLYLEIAEKLGHKKFSKKSRLWEDNFNVTIHHYIQPELVEKINLIAE
ncbi:MAG: hypothetical protein IIA88_11595 [Bacteroidetes bacterium]|nr:hypothetical protein [Bacteroidota bacterium]